MALVAKRETLPPLCKGLHAEKLCCRIPYGKHRTMKQENTAMVWQSKLDPHIIARVNQLDRVLIEKLVGKEGVGEEERHGKQVRALLLRIIFAV